MTTDTAPQDEPSLDSLRQAILAGDKRTAKQLALAFSRRKLGKRDATVVLTALVFVGCKAEATDLARTQSRYENRPVAIHTLLAAFLMFGHTRLYLNRRPMVAEGFSLDQARLSVKSILAGLGSGEPSKEDGYWAAFWASVNELAAQETDVFLLAKLLKGARPYMHLLDTAPLWAAYTKAGRRTFSRGARDVLEMPVTSTTPSQQDEARLEQIYAWLVPSEGYATWRTSVLRGYDRMRHYEAAAECGHSFLQTIDSSDDVSARIAALADEPRPIIFTSGHFAPVPIYAEWLRAMPLDVLIAADPAGFHHKADYAQMVVNVPKTAAEPIRRFAAKRQMIDRLRENKAVFVASDIGSEDAKKNASRQTPMTIPKAAAHYNARVFWMPITWTGQTFRVDLVEWECPQKTSDLTGAWLRFLEEAFHVAYLRDPANTYRSTPPVKSN